MNESSSRMSCGTLRDLHSYCVLLRGIEEICSYKRKTPLQAFQASKGDLTSLFVRALVRVTSGVDLQSISKSRPISHLRVTSGAGPNRIESALECTRD